MKITTKKIETTDNDKTELVFIVDRSGSMNSIRTDVIGGLNAFLDEQKNVDGELYITYCQFDDEYEIVHKSVSLDDMPEFDESNYVPRGMTALLDAIGRTLNDLEARMLEMDKEDRPSKVVVVIVTDGQENSSKEFVSADEIKTMVENHTNDNNWQFVYLAADQAAFNAGASYGMLHSNSMKFAASSKGTTNAIRAASSNLSAYRSTSNADDLSYSDEDRASALEED